MKRLFFYLFLVSCLFVFLINPILGAEPGQITCADLHNCEARGTSCLEGKKAPLDCEGERFGYIYCADGETLRCIPMTGL